jgi:transposase
MTDEEKAQAIAIVQGGLSYSDAGRRFGVSRSVIAGIIYRTRPENNDRIQAERRARRREEGAKPRQPSAAPPKKRGISLANVGKILLSIKTRAPRSDHTTDVSIVDVTGCRYSVATEGRIHLFCNAPTARGSWCDHHKDIVFDRSRRVAR